MQLLINTDASSGQKMEIKGFPLTHQDMLTSPTLCNLTVMLVSPFTFALWAGPAQIQMLLTWAALILLSRTPLMDSVPTKKPGINPLCQSLWPWDITSHRPGERHGARDSLWWLRLKGSFLPTGEFSARGCFIQPLYAASVLQVSCTRWENWRQRWRDAGHACSWPLRYMGKTILKFLSGISYKSLVQKYAVPHLFNYIFCATDDKSKMYSPNAMHRFSSE